MTDANSATMAHPKAFISHAGEDRDRFVTDFARRLIGKGVDAWYAKWEMKPGDKLIDKIFEEGIGGSDTLIIVLSDKSVNKPWVREEMDAGFVRRVEGKMRLIPVVIGECEIPVALQSTYRVRIKDLSSYDAQLDEIVAAIFGLSDKPELGNVPAHTQAQVIAIPNLARVDNIVLRLACEDSVEKDEFASNSDAVWARAEPLGISRQDVDDALNILDQYGFIEGHRGGDRMYAFTITLYGFHEYAKAYVPDLDSILNAVIARIVNDRMSSSGAIRQSLGQPRLIIEYLLGLLARNGKLSLSKPLGRETYIGGVSPELKRMLQ